MLTEDLIKQILQRNKPLQQWVDNSTAAAAMEIHSDGNNPGKLLTERRPNEPNEAKVYREAIFVPITKTAFSKVLNVIKRIPKANDYSIKFGAPDPKVQPQETLEYYTTKNYPNTGSLSNWFWGYAVKLLMTDPNALIFIKPIYPILVDDTKYYQPCTYIIESENIWDYKADEYAAFLVQDILYLVDENYWYTYKKDKDQQWVKYGEPYAHGISKMPVFQLGGHIKEIKDYSIIYESFLSGMKPFLDEAIREYSDLQIEAVQHIHSERWSFAQQDCNSCNGTGKETGELRDGKQIICQTCKGSGVKSPSPFTQIVVRPAKESMGEQTTPIPPAGYITKNTEIIKIQDLRIENHIKRAYSAINFDFLANVSNVQSGDAKSLDRQELNAFIYSVAATCVDIMLKSYWFINEYRYRILIPNADNREKQLPTIPVPEKFDILSENYLIAEYDSAKKAGLSSPVLKRMELDIIEKKYVNEPELKAYVKAIKQLDPLADESEGDKVLILNNKGITGLDYYISSNIQALVDTAIEENNNFLLLPMSDQETILEDIAKQDYLLALRPVQNSIEGALTGGIQEVQAKLRASGAGMASIIALQTNVKNGTVQLDAAVKTLEVVFGIEPAVAAQMLGNPIVEMPIVVGGGVNDKVAPAENDIQAEAQAKLKGSVGGVEGVLQLQASVAQGITSRDAAISLLEVIYGIPKNLASQIVGHPTKILLPTAPPIIPTK